MKPNSSGHKSAVNELGALGVIGQKLGGIGQMENKLSDIKGLERKAEGKVNTLFKETFSG